MPVAALRLLWLALLRLGLSPGHALKSCLPEPSWAVAPPKAQAGAEPCEPRRKLPAAASEGDAPARRLQRIYKGGPPFFDDGYPPYVNTLIHDSNDYNCDLNTTTPKTDPNEAGYPADGTAPFRKNQMSCGVTIARFVFFTTNKPDYTDSQYTAKMQVKVDCWASYFIESDTCENVLDATSNDTFGFPRIAGCTFMAHEARFILSTRLKPNTRYDLTVKMLNPPGRWSASDNSFHLTTEYYQLKVIEGTKSPIDMTYIIPNTKDWSELTPTQYAADWERQRGYITSFLWQPITGEWFPDVGLRKNRLHFSIRTWGVMTGVGHPSGNRYAIMFVAYPTNVWKFCVDGVCKRGTTPADACEWSPGPSLNTANCNYASFQGASATEANGFLITVRGTPFKNMQEEFTMIADNPMIGLNMYWTATSYRYDSGGAMYEPYTVILNSPVPVLGEIRGQVVNWEIAAASQEQWLELEFKPGNTLLGSQTSIAGTLVIIPPDNFGVVASASPQGPDPMYNSLPCSLWPSADREVTVTPRWVCILADQALFRTTSYRVQLRVQNPDDLGAARSWRVEMWQFFSAGGWAGGNIMGNRPISVTRSLLGMPVSGTMTASVAPQNQLLGGQNLLRFEFTPSHDIGGQPLTRLKVVAPTGFVIVKRCLGFQRDPPMVLPPCDCQGSDTNTFDLVFTYGDAIKGGNRYIFQLIVTNPTVNVPTAQNIWKFDTVRPDGIPRDTARYQGFFLFPQEMARFTVAPVTRQVGPNPVIVRFISSTRIPFDDFLTIRAPIGVNWYQKNLGFSSNIQYTKATTLGTQPPVVDPSNNNILTVQLTTAAEANVEYGLIANCIIPDTTPVPNRWWIEQKRQTGLAPPNNWRYIASTGGEGFKSLVLINAVVEPFNIVEEAWANPTLITFQATQPVQPTTKVTSSGIVNVSAELLVVAPPGFTWVCPLSATVYLPDFAVPVPSDVTCYVDHNNLATRNQLSLMFPSGIKADVRYALTVDLVNGLIATLDLSKNYFRLVTRIDKVEVEAVRIPGFLLAQRMDNTRFLNLPSSDQQNFFPEFSGNKVTFYIGTTAAIKQDTILEVKAPRGFVFNPICTPDVGYPGGQFGLPGMIQLPTIVLCQSLVDQDIDLTNVAHLTMTGPWLLGTTGIYVRVKNPMRTPPINFWGFTIMTTSGTPLQSEARVYGFEIAVVVNPIMRPYNRGDTVDREAAINRVELSFSLTTYIPGAMDRRNTITVTAPQGFVFPRVCRYYSPGTGNPGTVSLPLETTCQGDGAQELTLTLPVMRALENKTRYEFRFLVLNPSKTFIDVDIPSRWWKITTWKSKPTKPVDQTRDIPSFPIYDRISFIQIDTLSQVGLNSTTIRMLFRTTAPLGPKQTITITPPPGFTFGGVSGGGCINQDPMIIKRIFDEDYNMKALIAGVTPLPEWVSCSVLKPPTNQVVLTNQEPLLGGRPLINGPVFELFVMNFTNAQASPAPGLNLFRVVAKTMVDYGQEEFAGDGWTIYPQLLLTQVATSNPGFGLYTNFTFTLQTVTAIPAGGSIRIVGPTDYYFGPLIETPLTAYNPLVSNPPPQGAMNNDRPNATIGCSVLRPAGWACPFDLTPCITAKRYTDLQSYGVVLTLQDLTLKNSATNQCKILQDKCANSKLSDLIGCESTGSELILELQDAVSLAAGRAFRFLVQGYNTRLSQAPQEYNSAGSTPCTTCVANTWSFQTRDSDSERTVLDKKEQIPGLSLLGVVTVLSIVPSDTKVGSIENFVTVTLRLDVPCDPKGTLRITHPMDYIRNANAAFQGAPVSTGPTFPRMTEIRQSLNVIEIIAIEERIQANVDIQISIIMSNPQIAPSRQNNIWTFEASSTRTGTKVIQDVNYNVSGFKIFGEFSRAQVTSTVLSPDSDSVIGVWFVLKSELPVEPQGYLKALRVWMPKGFYPTPPPKPPLWKPVVCGDSFSYTYNPNREGVVGFPSTIDYFGLPSGSYCYNQWDDGYQQYYVNISIDGPSLVEYGLDYAFEFGVHNPQLAGMPPPDQNTWRLETVMEGVILHLQTGIAGFDLEQMKVARLTYEDTTKRRTLHPITFNIESEKYVPGGSKLIITGPDTFQVGCVFFRPLVGLSSTTTCLVTSSNVVAFTIDSQDPHPANTPMQIRVMWTNPEFTPQQNWWKFQLVSPLGKAIDVRDFVPGFDITDRVEVDIEPTFAYLAELNPLQVSFLQYTIMNQADRGNELVLTGPPGYVFPEVCQAFRLRLTDDPTAGQGTTTPGYPATYSFPPVGTTCMGFGNSTVVVRLPNGSGLLRNNYTLEVGVENPGYRLNSSIPNTWSFITRVRNENGTKIVDANRTVPGFPLSELVPLRTDEGGARRAVDPLRLAGVPLVALVAALLAAGGASTPGRWMRL